MPGTDLPFSAAEYATRLAKTRKAIIPAAAQSDQPDPTGQYDCAERNIDPAKNLYAPDGILSGRIVRAVGDVRHETSCLIDEAPTHSTVMRF